MRRLMNSFSPADMAASKPTRSPFLMQVLSGRKRDSRRGKGARRVLLGSLCVLTRWHGMR